MKKSFLIIGLGRFGSHLCKDLAALGHEIMIVDQDEEWLEPLLPYVTDSRIGDCTKVQVLESLGIGNFDKCFVCIGRNFQNSLEITSLLKELGAKYVISEATRDIQAKFLLRNGADEIIYPERDMAEKAAIMYSSDSVFDYFELAEDFSMYELEPLPEWIGKSLAETDLRRKMHISVAAVHTESGTVAMPPADYRFKENEHIMVIGRNEDIRRVVSRYKN